MAEKENSVESIFKSGEESLKEQVAVQAIGMVKPMLMDCSDEIKSYLGKGEKSILINNNVEGTVTGILVFDNLKEFLIKGGGAKVYDKDGNEIKIFDKKGNEIKSDRFILRGSKDALLKQYTVDEFVELLLTGRLKELTSKLMK